MKNNQNVHKFTWFISFISTHNTSTPKKLTKKKGVEKGG